MSQRAQLERTPEGQTATPNQIKRMMLLKDYAGRTALGFGGKIDIFVA
jgi:hypothetical protein